MTAIQTTVLSAVPMAVLNQQQEAVQAAEISVRAATDILQIGAPAEAEAGMAAPQARFKEEAAVRPTLAVKI